MNILIKNIFAVSSALALALASSSATAATDGLPGPEFSEGNLVVTLDIDTIILLTGLDDILFDTEFDTLDAFFNAVKTDDMCVFINLAAAQYQVTASSGIGGAGGFEVDRAATEQIDYFVEWNGTALLSTVQNVALFTAGATADELNCTVAGENATIEITIPGASIALAGRGVYTDLLTIFVDAI